MKTTFTFGLRSMNPAHPPVASSKAQFAHHGAQKCTTVARGDATAASTCRSIGSGSAARSPAHATSQMQNRAGNFTGGP